MRTRPRPRAGVLTQFALAGVVLAARAPIVLAQSPDRPRPNGGENLQVVDTSFRVTLRARTYRPGKGPVVTVDEAHHNFHTIGGRYRPFANLVEADGFTVRPGRALISA